MHIVSDQNCKRCSRRGLRWRSNICSRSEEKGIWNKALKAAKACLFPPWSHRGASRPARRVSMAACLRSCHPCTPAPVRPLLSLSAHRPHQIGKLIERLDLHFLLSVLLHFFVRPASQEPQKPEAGLVPLIHSFDWIGLNCG